MADRRRGAAQRVAHWSNTLDDLIGDVKVRSDSTQPVFVGIGPVAAVDAYLRGVSREEVADLADATGTVIAGTRRPGAPEAQRFWVASSSGSGRQALGWNVSDGDWRVVVMAPDATRGMRANMAAGAELPGLLTLALSLTAGGLLLLGASGVILVAAVRGSRTKPAT